MGERGTWEVPVGFLRGETEGNGFFRRVSGATEVVNEKMMNRPPSTDFAVISTGVEWEFGSM